MESFASLRNRGLVLPAGDDRFSVDHHFFSHVMAEQLRRIHVDEAFYRLRNPDIADAIDEGHCASAAEHYVMHGFYENRMPHPIDVNEDWYLRQNPDVSAAIAQGVFDNGQAHFVRRGFREGRLPFPNFSLLSPVPTPAPSLEIATRSRNARRATTSSSRRRA